MARAKILMTGAAGYIASQLLPTFRARYDLVLVDGDPTVHVQDTRRIVAVWKRGVRLDRVPSRQARSSRSARV